MFSPLKSQKLGRLVCLLIALLISNVAAATCAAALYMDNDCPVEEPTHCAEMYEADATVTSDSPSGKKLEQPTFFIDRSAYQTFSIQSGSNIPATFVRQRLSSDSPPLNVLYCVYLK